MTGLGFGILGTGVMGRGLAEAMRDRIDEARVVAAFDPHQPACDAFCRDFEARGAASVEELLAIPEVDAVAVATPNHLHCPQTVAAADAGKHVFCEKPMALSAAECDEMIGACEDAGVKLMVGQSSRLSSLSMKLQAVLSSGEIGEPVFGAANYFFSGFKERSSGVWHTERASSGGLFFQMAIHQIDLLQAVLGQVRRVQYAGGRHGDQVSDFHDVASVLLEFASGATGVISAASISAVNATDMRFVCTRGFVNVDSLWTYFEYGSDAEQMTRVSAEELDGPDPYELELRSFARWVLYDEKPVLTAAEGRAAVAVAEAAQEAERTGQPVVISSG